MGVVVAPSRVLLAALVVLVVTLSVVDGLRMPTRDVEDERYLALLRRMLRREQVSDFLRENDKEEDTVDYAVDKPARSTSYKTHRAGYKLHNARNPSADVLVEKLLDEEYSDDDDETDASNQRQRLTPVPPIEDDNDLW